MTDEMKVALVAVAMSAGQSVERAWDMVEDYAAEAPTGDARALTQDVLHRATAAAWGSAGKGMGLG